MRRWLVAVVAAATLAGLSACGDKLPQGLDGDLTNGWQKPPVAAQWRPDTGTCHTGRTDYVAQGQDSNIACDGQHEMETVSIADLPVSVTDEDAGSTTAFKLCIPQVNKFIGDDYRNGWVVIQPVLPATAAWEGGARWYRCDVGEMSKGDGSVVSRSGSMKGTVAVNGSLRQGCFNAVIGGERLTNLRPVACGVSHDSEYAGYFTPKQNTLSQSIVESGCKAAIAKYAHIANDGNFKYRTGWLSVPTEEGDWDLGDHTVRCYIWQDSGKVTGSFKNAGPNRMRIHYA